MRFKLFLAIGGEHFDAQGFERSVAQQGSRVRRIGHRGQTIDPTKVREWAVWESSRIDGSNDPGDDIVKLLDENADALARFKALPEGNAECWVGIVGYHLEAEGPRGFSFSRAVIERLAAAGASLEIDTVYDMAAVGHSPTD